MTNADYETTRGAPLLPSADVETATWLVELGVGIACLALGAGAWRAGRSRIVGAVLIVAGLAAAIHALVQLAGA
ncbi:MAG TPA: hypothetical protein VNC60_07010 [Actinomycetota bacterium]|nr:hypothetical protein [Actinomycetota bacterium]